MQLVFNQYKSGYVTSINEPVGAIPTVPKQNILSFIFNPSHGGHVTSVNNPAPTVIARQDKAPLSLIKIMMNEYGILDIKKRMLKIPELLQIQGFPRDYLLDGNQKEQKKQIGNAVDVFQSTAIAKGVGNALSFN